MRDHDWQIIEMLHSTQSITKTAELLYMSQSSLTKRIQTIEEELGITLLVRTHQGSAFTIEGERIVEKSKQVLAAIQSVKDEVSAIKTGDRGHLRLGVPYSYVRHVLPSILKQFVSIYPNVDIEVFTLPSQDLIKCVENGTIDVCFARYNAEESPLRRILFSEEQACVVYNKPIDLKNLAELPCIDFSKNPGTNSALKRWWDERFDVPRNIRFSVTTSDACVAMVKHGLGYGFVLDPEYIQYETGLWSIPLEYLDGAKLTRSTWIFFREGSTHNSYLNGYLNLLIHFER